MSLSEERAEGIRSEVERALSHHLGAQVKSVSLGLCRPRLLRDGEAFELVFDEGRIALSRLDVSGIEVDGTLAFEDLRLDYAALGVGDFRLTHDPKVFPNLSTTMSDLEAFMSEQGLRDTFLDFDKESGELVLGGRRPTRVLLSRFNPLVTVRGRFSLDDNVVAFEVTDVDVRDAPGFVAREIDHRVRNLARKTVDLDEVLAGLRVGTIQVGGGEVRVVSEGGVLFAHRIEAGADSSAG